MMAHLYQLKTKEILLTKKPLSVVRGEYPRIEMIGTFSTIENARKYIAKNYKNISSIGFIDEFNGKIEYNRSKCFGWYNEKGVIRGPRPLWVRLAISRNRKGICKSYEHYNYGMPKSPFALEQIRKGVRRRWRERPMKWCIDPNGRQFRKPLDFVLPSGWVLGRVPYGRSKTRFR